MRGAVLLEASTEMRSDLDWHRMRAAAFPMLSRLAQGAKSALNGRRGRRRLPISDAERKIIRRIMESRRYKNWEERRAAIEVEGIPCPSHTYVYNRIMNVS